MKYIIELGEEANMVQVINVTQNGNAYVDAEYVTELEELNSDYINEHFGDLQDTAYQRGLEDGKKATWEAVRKVIHLPEGVVLDLFTDCYSSVCTVLQVFLKYEGSEVIEKLKAYEEKKDDKIGVGDVVETKSGTIFAVTKITPDGFVVGFTGDGSTCCFNITKLTKTGEHYNINEILGGLCDD